jgi:hypothetical protein
LRLPIIVLKKLRVRNEAIPELDRDEPSMALSIRVVEEPENARGGGRAGACRMRSESGEGNEAATVTGFADERIASF